MKFLTRSLALLLSLFIMSQFAQGATELDQDYQKARDLMTQINSKDFNVVTEALKNMKGLEFIELYDAVRGVFLTEISKGRNGQKPNTHFLSASMIALSHYVNKKTASEIEDLLKQYEKAKSEGVFSQVKGLSFVDSAKGALASALSNSSRESYNLKSMASIAAEQDSLVEKLENSKEGQIVIAGTVTFIRDEALERKAAGDYIPVVGREKEVLQTLEVLARIKGKNPVLVGSAGVGKTAIVNAIDELCYLDQLPNTKAFEQLKGMTLIETTPARISTMAQSNGGASQAAAIEMYVEAVSKVQKELGIPITIFIDEAHTLDPSQVEALKRYMDSQGNLMFIFASTSEEFNMAFKNNKAFLRRVKQIGVEELSHDKIKGILLESWVPKIEFQYGVLFSEEVIDRVIEDSSSLLPNNGKMDGSIKILQDLGIRFSVANEEDSREINKAEYSSIVKEYYSLPVDPNNFTEFFTFFEEAETELNKKVIGQPRMVKDVLAVYSGLLQSRNKQVASVYALGTTGTGKTFLGESLAQVILRNKAAFFEINGNEHSAGGFEGNSLFGAPNGVTSSDKTSGQFMEWLDDLGRGGKGGIVLINEIEKMHMDHQRRIMELQDRGIITGGDGKVRRVKNLLFIMTSNRSVDMIFPKAWSSWTESEMEQFVAKLDSDALKEIVDFKSEGNYRDEHKLPPEIKNRIDLFTLSVPLSLKSALSIGHNYLESIIARFKYDSEIEVKMADEVRDLIIEYNYNSEFGARPITRAMEKLLTDIKQKVSKTLTGKEQGVHLDIQLREGKIIVLYEGQVVGEQNAPAKPITDPLLDPSTFTMIQDLQDKMSERIFGQEEMINRISDALISHIGSADNRDRALSLFLVGSTGTGKSETAKSIAEVRYGSKTRVGFINLGTVRFEGDFNTIFNPPPGFVGGDKAGLFESYLLSNPEGGVLLLDEASNMGGNRKDVKDELFKMLYEMTDEKYWTSSATGKRYDISKHTFIFTGNDGERIFMGVGADDLRLAEWDENRTQGKIHKLLVEGGVPEAFLGRMMDLILMKPLTRKIVSEKIAPKFLDPLFEKLKSQGVEVETSESFSRKMGEIFFTQNKGARSLRAVAESQLQSALVKARMVLIRAGDGKGKIRLELKDNMPGTPYLEDHFNFERKVEIVASVYGNDGTELDEIRVEASDFADSIHLMSKEQATLTSYHEAGHAIANRPEFTNDFLKFITILGRGEYLGYARYKPVPGHPSLTHEVVVNRVARLLAGSMAQQLAGFSADAGMRGDLEQARALVRAAITEYGIYPEFLAELPQKGQAGENNFKLNTRMMEKSAQLFREAYEVALERLVSNWGHIEKIVEVLIVDGEISADVFSEILKTPVDNSQPKEEFLIKTGEYFERINPRNDGSDFLKPQAVSMCSRLFGVRLR